MKRLISLMMCAVSLGAAAQSTITYPFNPDANSDGFVGVSDILEGVATYDNFFSPGEIMVGDTALGEWLSSIQNVLTQQQAEIDSIQNLVGTQTSNDSAGNVNAFALGATEWQGWMHVSQAMMAASGYQWHFFEIDNEGDGFLSFCNSVCRTVQMDKSHVIDWSDESVLDEIWELSNVQGTYHNHQGSWGCNTFPIPASDKLIVIQAGSNNFEKVSWTPIVQTSFGGDIDGFGDSDDAAGVSDTYEAHFEVDENGNPLPLFVPGNPKIVVCHYPPNASGTLPITAPDPSGYLPFEEVTILRVAPLLCTQECNGITVQFMRNDSEQAEFYFSPEKYLTLMKGPDGFWRGNN